MKNEELLSRFDHVQLAMPEGQEERARMFYVAVLGMVEVPKPPELALRGGAWFRSGDVFLHLGVDPNFQPATKAHPAFRCRDYDALLDRLGARQAKFTTGENPFLGARHCYIADPFGNRIELIEDRGD